MMETVHHGAVKACGKSRLFSVDTTLREEMSRIHLSSSAQGRASSLCTLEDRRFLAPAGSPSEDVCGIFTLVPS